jgi:secondary thiamine-phosphate synthase enzyme
MRQFTKLLHVETRGQGLYEFTRDVTSWVNDQEVETGLLTLFCRHTSASLLIQENASSAVHADLETFFKLLAPEEEGRYRHDEEGLDDMPAHIRSALTNVSLSVPIIEGRLMLGPWQGIYLYEHRRAAHRRDIALHLFGD